MQRRTRKFGAREPSRAWSRRRAQVERLEDRVLLSASPIVIEAPDNSGKPISAVRTNIAAAVSFFNNSFPLVYFY